LSAVLGKPDLGFAKPIFDLVDNPHLSPLIKAGVPPCVWADKLLHDKGLRTVLTVMSAATEGQELLFDFLGTYTYNVYTQYVQRLLSVVPCTYCLCNVTCMCIPCMYNFMNAFHLFMLGMYLLIMFKLCTYFVCTVFFHF
jgi:hypothetical protein